MKKQEWQRVRFAAYEDEDLIQELKRRGYVVMKTT
jgi:hypothetical protein